MSPKAVEFLREDCALSLGGDAEMLSPLKGQRLVVTGGTGFVGSWLAEFVAYLNDKHAFGTHVTLIARTPERFASARPHLAARNDIKVLRADARFLTELPQETNWLVHAAGVPDTRFHASQPIETMSLIADGTSSVLRAVDRCSDFKMMLNLSSAAVYGAQPVELERIAETHQGGPSCGSAASAYAEAKRYGETLCASARTQARIPIITARPFAFVGPYMPANSPFAIVNFIQDAMNGRAIRVFSDGQTVRSYMYASDMANWILRMLVRGESGATYNLGSPEAVTLEALAGEVSSQFSPRPEIHLRTDPRASHRSRLVPDVGAAVEKLRLQVRVPLKTAIERSVAWQRFQ